MKNVHIIDHPCMLQQAEVTLPELSAGDYRQRIDILRERMSKDQLTHVVVYGNRERFANIQYLTGYDPRYEEALAVIDAAGETSIMVGNEGYAYASIVPFPAKIMLYQNFSLQGQPRDKLVPLADLFARCGIDKQSRVGIIGFKFYDAGSIRARSDHYDIPAYIVQELYVAADRERVCGYTQVMTDKQEGIRLYIRTAKEIAIYEYAATRASNVISGMIRNLRPGITELELSRKAGIDATPTSVFPIVNFGAENMRLVLRSPNDTPLRLGTVVGLDFGVRGALSARFGVAAYDAASYDQPLRQALEAFFKPYYLAVATWYEQIRIGARSGDVYDRVMQIIGSETFGVSLNPGHNIGGDEWVNSTFYQGSDIELPSGFYLQSDIIASSSDPVMIGICEDGVILADARLRAELKKEYPEVADRIAGRQRFMRETLGINLSDDVLPLSNLCGVYFPFMLDTTKIFALR